MRHKTEAVSSYYKTAITRQLSQVSGGPGKLSMKDNSDSEGEEDGSPRGSIEPSSPKRGVSQTNSLIQKKSENGDD